MKPDKILSKVKKLRLHHKLGISRQAINKWTRIPASRVIPIERLTGFPRKDQRPDLEW